MRWILLIALVSMWGSSFLFTKIAVSALSPSTIVAARLVIGAVVLTPILLAMGRNLMVSPRAWVFLACMAVMGNALPFWLISWGQQGIDSGLAGILMAVMPLTTLVLAHVFIEGERLTAQRATGFAIGFLGIVVLVGPEALMEFRGTGTALVSELAVLGGAVCYAVNGIVARRRPPVDALTSATGVALIASMIMIPVAAFEPIRPEAISLPVIAAIVFLGVVSTAIAIIVYFRLVALAGPSFMSLINYLIPLWALSLGIIVLDEQPSWRALLALALVLSGIALSEFRPASKV
ncbi:MAG: DMT family transporter [Rhodospirillales bacterium]|nr:DMT family transporter [Rhodospirillales bacterium]